MTNDYDMDEASIALIIRLELQESLDFSTQEEERSKGKGREGDLSDLQVALQLHREDLQRNASIIADRQMTASIARACQEDGHTLAAMLSMEQAEANDREAACRLGGIEVTVNDRVPPWTISSEEMDEELLAKLSALYVAAPLETSDHSDDEHEEAEASAWAASRARAPPSIYRQCVSCQEQKQYFYTARAPCGHEYCCDCLRVLFENSMTDDTLFPPRCCRQAITTSAAQVFVPGELMKRYEQKKIEMETPNRTYCSNPVCSAFLTNIQDDNATCTSCGTVTCTLCKGANHGGDCPSDTALQQVLQTADENGWQRCYSCRRLVELDIGCNHITFVLLTPPS